MVGDIVRKVGTQPAGDSGKERIGIVIIGIRVRVNTIAMFQQLDIVQRLSCGLIGKPAATCVEDLCDGHGVWIAMDGERPAA